MASEPHQSKTRTGIAGVNFLYKTDVAKAGTMAMTNGVTENKRFDRAAPIVRQTADKLWRLLAETTLNAQAAVNILTGLIGKLYGFKIGDPVAIWDVSAGVALVTGRVVVDVDNLAGTIELDGAPFTTEAGDYIHLEGVDFEQVGIADNSGVFTIDLDSNGDPVRRNIRVRVIDTAIVVKSALLNTNPRVLGRLTNITFVVL